MRQLAALLPLLLLSACNLGTPPPSAPAESTAASTSAATASPVVVTTSAPTAAPTATASQAMPAPPIVKDFNWYCDGVKWDNVSISWSEKSTNVTGYRVYHNGNLVKTLPANVTYYSAVIHYASGLPEIYEIFADNASGASSSGLLSFKCQ